MSIMSRSVHLWQSLFRRKQAESELSDEIRAYLDLLADQKISAGIDEAKARREAALALGGVEQVKESVRESRMTHNIESLLRDARHAIRSIKASPGTAALSILMLTLGIGATTLIFSVFYSVLLKPLPFPQPERLVELWETRITKGWKQASFSEANFWDVRSRTKSFEEMAAIGTSGWNMTGYGEPEHVDVAQVSAGFFRVLGVNPKLGRGFLANEDQPAHHHQVILLSDRYWKSRFHADKNVVRRTLRLDGRPYTVIGVLPAGEPWLDAASMFVTRLYSLQGNRGSFELSVIARLKPGVTTQAASADLQNACRSLAEQYPQFDKDMGTLMAPAAQWGADAQLRRALSVLLVAVGLLLLIACVNLANLLLAKSTARRREMTMRAALGASRGQIVRLVLIESLLLSGAGVALGLCLAFVGMQVIRASNLAGIPRLSEINVNGWVLAFSVAAGLVTGVLSGLIPALYASSKNIAVALRDGDRSQTGSRSQARLSRLFVTAEVALSLMLLVGAGLMIRSFTHLLSVERGFQSTNRLLFTVNVPSSYDEERATSMAKGLLDNIESLPQVVKAGAANTRPISGWDPGMGIAVVGDERANVPWASWRWVSKHYFDALSTPLLEGRVFTDRDKNSGVRPVVINKRLADLLWPDQRAVGQRAFLWKGQGNDIAEVVGVVADMRERGLDAEIKPLVYMPFVASIPLEFIVHTKSAPTNIVSTLRSRLAEIDPNLPLSRVTTLDDVVSTSLSSKEFNMIMLAVFAAISLLLAMAGIYGVLSYTVARRIPEIGLRVTLGATRSGVAKLIVGQGMQPIVAGMIIGFAGAFAASRFLATILFEIKPADPLTYTIVAVLIFATGFAACLAPALRASRIDPAAALRRE